MRRRTLLCLAALTIAVSAQVVPNHVSLNEKRKHIEVDSTWLDKKQKEVQRVALDASNKEKVVLDLLNTNQRFSASSAGNVAAAETFDGKRAQVQKIGDKGGIATVDGHKAQLRTKTDGEGEHALLKADGKYELDTVAKGDLKGDPSKTEFEAKNERLDFKLNPHAHNNNSGDGTLSFYDKESHEMVRITTTHAPRLLYPPTHQNLLYSIFPTLQKEKDWRKYCPANQYQFQITCRPGKKLRYDLQLFCQQFSDMCGVPNINLYPSRYQTADDEGRPAGYGQKQKNGNVGIGRSWALGLGVIPGMEVRTSQGADIGNEKLPFFDQIGGMMLNYGGEVGVLGHRTGKGPARSMNALARGYPSFGLGPPNKAADSQFGESVAKALGVPSLNNVFGKLAKNSKNKKITGYEPGYGAVNPHGPFAIGKTDLDDINLPGGFGAVEVIRGSGMGIGKK